MGQPAPRPSAPDAPPAPDPLALERAYRRQRAKRAARSARRRERRNAHIRFFVVVLLLLGLSVAVALTAWREIEQLFGL